MATGSYQVKDFYTFKEIKSKEFEIEEENFVIAAESPRKYETCETLQTEDSPVKNIKNIGGFMKQKIEFTKKSVSYNYDDFQNKFGHSSKSIKKVSDANLSLHSKFFAKMKDQQSFRVIEKPANSVQIVQAIHKNSKLEVSLKIISKIGIGNKSLHEKRDEIQMYRNATHYGVVRMLDYFETKT